MVKSKSYGMAIVIVLVAVALIGLSYMFLFQGGTGNGSTTTTLAGSSTTVPVTTTTIAVTQVSVYSDRFDPTELNMTASGKVKWLNVDTKQHEVVCVDSSQTPLFDATINAGESFLGYIAGNADCWDPSVGENIMRMKITISA